MAAATDVGRVRKRNEDSFRILPELGLVIVCDGMGGHQSGHVASQLAVSLLTQELRRHFPEGGAAPEPLARRYLKRALRQANEAIIEAAATNRAYMDMGATALAVSFGRDALRAAHVGDTRLYCLRHGALHALTQDHTLHRKWIEDGVLESDEGLISRARNILTRSLGIDPALHADITESDVQPGDVYLLCSDGLHGAVEHEQIRTLLLEPRASLKADVMALVDAANAAGGQDNVTVVLCRQKSVTRDS
jgi:protein phosphatase